jgi:DNA-binding LacI/PurR family transcriptional regulator
MITMRDIAVRAGVSRSTVSFVLNEKHAAMGVN